MAKIAYGEMGEIGMAAGVAATTTYGAVAGTRPGYMQIGITGMLSGEPISVKDTLQAVLMFGSTAPDSLINVKSAASLAVNGYVDLSRVSGSHQLLVVYVDAN